MIDVEQRGRVSIFHMRHRKANVMDVEFCEAMTAQLEAYRHASAQALVLIGQGQIFSAGVDLLRVLEERSRLPRHLPAGLVYASLRRCFAYPKPVVAAINGHAIAGGCVLACAWRTIDSWRNRPGA